MRIERQQNIWRNEDNLFLSVYYIAATLSLTSIDKSFVDNKKSINQNLVNFIC